MYVCIYVFYNFIQYYSVLTLTLVNKTKIKIHYKMGFDSDKLYVISASE